MDVIRTSLTDKAVVFGGRDPRKAELAKIAQEKHEMFVFSRMGRPDDTVEFFVTTGSPTVDHALAATRPGTTILSYDEFAALLEGN